MRGGAEGNSGGTPNVTVHNDHDYRAVLVRMIQRLTNYTLSDVPRGAQQWKTTSTLQNIVNDIQGIVACMHTAPDDVMRLSAGSLSPKAYVDRGRWWWFRKCVEELGRTECRMTIGHFTESSPRCVFGLEIQMGDVRPRYRQVSIEHFEGRAECQ
ncbi:hypothetical protein K474DRAFT_1714239 [Panus rudis PR-1116 ss-1]|nr:hypothetical protein K474DRAFT_1714239 [Panus rudis PR-1116 ss-1]